MKLYGNLLTFLALESSSAFINRPAQAFTAKGSLYSSGYSGDMNGDSAAKKGPDSTYSPDINVSELGRAASDLSYSDSAQTGAGQSSYKDSNEIFDTAPTVTVQGSTLRTCSFDSVVERVQVGLKTEGRPLTANVELWQGPDNTPQKISVYLEDGSERPFCSVIETPSGTNSIAIRNTGMMEFPLTACIDAQEKDDNLGESPARTLMKNSPPRTVQGGAVFTAPFPPGVASVQVVLRTDGRPLNARVELLQGPNNNKQVMELYSEDGSLRPFYAVIETPGSGNVVRIVNTSTVEFPLSAHVEPFMIENGFDGEGGSNSPGGLQWSD